MRGPTPPIVHPYLRLLEGVQKFGVLESGVAGWTTDANKPDNTFYTRTNYGTYDPLQPPDLYVFGGYAGDSKVGRTLPGKGRPWELVGSVYFGTGISNGMFTPSSFLYLKVYDAKDRPLAVIENRNKDPGQYGHPSLLVINGTTVYEASDPFATGPLVRTWVPFRLAFIGRWAALHLPGKDRHRSGPRTLKASSSFRRASAMHRFSLEEGLRHRRGPQGARIQERMIRGRTSDSSAP